MYVLAHVPDDTRGITPDLWTTMVRKNMAMSPTLKMFTTTVTTDPHYMDPMYEEVRTFHGLGGTLLFGTDVGYMTDYSPEGAFVSLGKAARLAGVLAVLTTNPAARMGAGSQGNGHRRQARRPRDPDAIPPDHEFRNRE